MRTSIRYLVAALLAASTLGGCGNNDDTPAAGTTVSGIAAIGAAISGGTVALRCGNGASSSTTSGGNGAWAAIVSSGDLPCAVRVSGGTVNGVANTETFHALALAGSGSARTAHLTPLGDLALASAVNDATGAALETWFESASDTQRQQVANSLAAAIVELDTALAAAGYTLPANFNPFTSAIVAGSAEDVYDRLLEAYKQALSDAGTRHADARAAYTAGGDLPAVAPGGDDEEPETPVTPAGSGLLGAILRDVFAGDYVLKCGRFGDPVKTLAFSIGPDGSSRFKGTALIDTAHRGRIELEGGPKSSLLYLRFYPYASGSDTVALGFKSDGSFYPNVVISDGQTLTCYNNTGHSAPAATAQAFSRIASVAGAQARTQALNCTRNNVSQTETLTIGNDGSAQVGSQSYSADHIASINDNILFGKPDNQTGTINYYDSGRSLGLSFRNEDIAGNGAIYSEGLGPDISICQP